MTSILKAKEILLNDGVVGIPTETVYGLAASIQSAKGIENIFKTKERPFFDPLIVHVSTISQAKQQASQWFDICDILAHEFWPGPMTMILPKSAAINNMITSGLDSVGIRIPKHKLAIELIETLGHPIAAPSANKFKKTSPTNAQHVRNEFPDIQVIDGGSCEIGIESTVLGVTQNKVQIFRPGMLTKSLLEELFQKHGKKVDIEYTQSPVAPGHLKHHYMPNLPIVCSWDNAINDTSTTTSIPKDILNSPQYWRLPSDPTLAARALYQKFRELDIHNATCIILELESAYKNQEQWIGVLNRIKKATTYELSK